MAAAHIVYLGLWRFLGAALLGVMRFIERPAARAGRFMAGSAPTFATLSTRAIMYSPVNCSRLPRQLGFILGYAQMLSAHPPFLGESYPLMYGPTRADENWDFPVGA